MCWAAGAILAAWPLAAQTPVLLVDPAGGAVDWWQLLDAGPRAAVVVWSSWVPGADEAARQFDAMASHCAEHGLRFLVVDSQEPFADAASALQQWSGLAWLHDRHGQILKHYRVVELPAVLIVDPDGALVARLAPAAAALQKWRMP